MEAPLVTVRPPNRQAFTVVLDSRLELGREADGIIVVDTRVSRRHVALEPGPDGTVTVIDLGSANGTTVDGVAVGGPTPARRGSVVRIGDTRIEISGTRAVGGAGAATAMATPTGGGTQSSRSSIDVVADAVVSDLGAELRAVADEPGTLTVVFSDIESSTGLAVALGDAGWFDVLRRLDELVRAHVRAHRGRVVKNQGDGHMLCFRSAHSAISVAIAIQRDLARTHWCPPGYQLRMRIGMHTGEVVMDDSGDLFGKHVVVAARIGALAAGDEILVSSLVRQIAEPRGDITFFAPRDVELRGLGGVETVWAVEWSEG
jgi:class 3 adenylate cyclase